MKMFHFPCLAAGICLCFLSSGCGKQNIPESKTALTEQAGYVSASDVSSALNEEPVSDSPGEAGFDDSVNVDSGECQSAEEPSYSAESADQTTGILGIDLSDPLGLQGEVYNVYCSDDSFEKLMIRYYPGYEEGEAENVAPQAAVQIHTGAVGDTAVRWTIVQSNLNEYQNLLDDALLNSETRESDARVDLFIADTSILSKYIDEAAGVTLTAAEIGLPDAEDTDTQYAFTCELADDVNGEQRAFTWQVPCGAFVYRRSFAETVFGTSEPEEIAKLISDSERMEEAAEKLYASGILMFSDTSELFYPMLSRIGGWVTEDGRINVDAQTMNWVETTKHFVDCGYIDGTEPYSAEWMLGLSDQGHVFGYFLTSEEVCRYAEGSDWSVCAAPRSYINGGSWICAAKDSDNKNLTKDLISFFVLNLDNAEEMTRESGELSNHREAMSVISGDASYGNSVFGGENDISIWSASAENMNCEGTTSYDAVLSEIFKESYLPYFNGEITEEEALISFYREALERYPDLLDG